MIAGKSGSKIAAPIRTRPTSKGIGESEIRVVLSDVVHVNEI